MEPDESIALDDVEVLSEGLERDRAVLTCCLGARRFAVPRYFVLHGSHVHKPGDRGMLLLPRWFATDLGLVRTPQRALVAGGLTDGGTRLLIGNDDDNDHDFGGTSTSPPSFLYAYALGSLFEDPEEAYTQAEVTGSSAERR